MGEDQQSLGSPEVHPTPVRHGVLPVVGCSVLVPVALSDFQIRDDLVSLVPEPFRLESRQVLCPQVEKLHEVECVIGIHPVPCVLDEGVPGRKRLVVRLGEVLLSSTTREFDHLSK